MANLKFKIVEKESGNIYYINDKEVTEETFNKLYNDENIGNFNVYNGKNSDNITVDEDYEDDCCNSDNLCEECQSILDLIHALFELDDEEAIETFREIIAIERKDAFIKGSISAYEEVSRFSNKIAARLENILDDQEDN